MSAPRPDPASAKVLDPKSRIGPVLENDHSDEIEPEAYRAWSGAAALWLSTLGIPLLAVPRITTFVFARLLNEVAEVSPHHVAASAAAAAAGAAADSEPAKPVIRSLNALEKVLGRFAGMMCIVLAALIVVQTGTVPLTTHAMTARSTSAPYRKPTIWITVAFFTMLAYSAYNLNILSVAIPSAAVSAWGFWVVIFAHQGKVNQVSSKTSSFPFKNVAAEEKKEEQRNKRE